jgi:peptidylprolyl isomerase
MDGNMVVKKGDFITINYTCKVKESGEVVETTLEKIAEKEGLQSKHSDERHEYEPLFIVIGEGWVPKGVDEAIEGMEVGQEKTFDLSPEKGFGVRDPSKMKLLPLRRFSKEGITPVPGIQLEVDGKPALIRSVGAGRVQVDFNHPLSGKSLAYSLKLESFIQEKNEKIRAVIHRRIPTLNLEKTEVRIVKNKVEINIPDDSFFIEGLQLAKRHVANDIHKYLPEYKSVHFIEKFIRSVSPGEAERKKSSPQKGTESPSPPQQSGKNRS